MADKPNFPPDQLAKFDHSFSFITLTPNSFAFYNFDPEFSPVTSISVDLLIDETTFAPSFSAFVFASALYIDDSVPVKIIFFPVIFDLTVSIFFINRSTLWVSFNICFLLDLIDEYSIND